MKKSILIFTSFIISIQFTVAQKSLYLDLGYNHSTITSNYLSAAYKSGYYGGLTFEDVYDNNVEVSTGIRLNRLGAKTVNGGTGYTFLDGVFNVGYRMVPEMTIQSGISVGTLLSGVPELVGREFDFGAHFGVKYNLKNYTIRAHFYRGLVDQAQGAQQDDAFFQYFQVGVGLRLTHQKQKTINDTTYVFIKPKKTLTKKPVSVEVELPGDSIVPHHRKHVGVILKNLTDFDLLFKRSIGKNRFIRFSLLSTSYSIQETDGQNSDRGLLSFDIGLEWQKLMGDRTSFVHGPRLSAGLDVTDFINQNFDSSLAFKYQFGIYYQLSERFDIGLEVLPEVRYFYSENVKKVDVLLNTQNVGIVLVHRFDYR